MRGGRPEAVLKGNCSGLCRVGACFPPKRGDATSGHKARRYTELVNGDFIWCHVQCRWSQLLGQPWVVRHHQNRRYSFECNLVLHRRRAAKKEVINQVRYISDVHRTAPVGVALSGLTDLRRGRRIVKKTLDEYGQIAYRDSATAVKVALQPGPLNGDGAVDNDNSGSVKIPVKARIHV